MQPLLMYIRKKLSLFLNYSFYFNFFLCRGVLCYVLTTMIIVFNGKLNVKVSIKVGFNTAYACMIVHVPNKVYLYL